METMQEVKIPNNLLSSDNLKSVEINNFSYNELNQKNFMNGLQNARNILTELERSLQKSSVYEKKLLQCKVSHDHSHDGTEWWDFESDCSDDVKHSTSTATKRSSRGQVDLAETWSTMSIVCLQYQYEELSKRYDSLLKAYNNKCADVSAREEALVRLRQKAKVMHAQLANVNESLLAVGEKYLHLMRRKQIQVCVYERKMSLMKNRLRDVVTSVEKARLQLDGHFSQNMVVEQDSNYALLLMEMRKCNQLFLENLRLKAQIEELMPGVIQWKN